MAVVALVGALPTAAEAQEGDITVSAGAEVVAGQYIVTLARGQLSASASELGARYGGTVRRTFSRALHGFVVTLPEKQARRMAADPRVARVEADAVVRGLGSRTTSLWNLDRSDQRTAILDGAYQYADEAGRGVTAYVLDTGIRMSHSDFGGRARFGFDAIGDGLNGEDCNTDGHGTHVAGTIGGATHGLADKVNLVSVRVLSCDNLGTISQIVAGVEWVTANAAKPAVVNMSLGAAGRSPTEEDAITASIATGLTYVIAAGNDAVDACTFSPAAVPNAITVAAANSIDERATNWGNGAGSNFGPCVDIFAPGQDIKSTHNATDSATRILRGTSMAAPHVAGAAALVLSRFPDATPAEVTAVLVNRATPGVLRADNLGSGSPNKLLYTGGAFEAPLRDFSVGVGSSTATVGAGQSVTVAVSTTNLIPQGQTIRLSATGAPAGATLSVNPAEVAAGQSATLTMSVAPGVNIPAGFTATVTGTGRYGLTRTASVAVTVPFTQVCSVSNTTTLPVPDLGTVSSTVEVTACPRKVASDATARVRAQHPYRGDLSLVLRAPDGTEQVLREADGDDAAADLDQVFPLRMSTVDANGVWTLVVRDNFGFDQGAVTGWDLVLAA
ncbi:S8 family peptidase [Saccharothrix variisporea]|uniref:S8 family peptidase n=1 Tax=Saccharothrix variisporea TaxID=543527 RepID=UPI0014772975|nr:S8 family peptidase [Saccharothrix variisporea]